MVNTISYFKDQKQILAAAIITLAAIGLGIYFLTNSRASTPFVSVEAESGTLDTGGIAIKTTNSTASGGSAVQFGTLPGSGGTPSILLLGFYQAPTGSGWPPVQIVTKYITNGCNKTLYTSLRNYRPPNIGKQILAIGTPMNPDPPSCAEGPSYTYNTSSNLAAYTTFAQNLVSGGQSHAIIRIGWEWSGNWYSWSDYGFAQYVRGFDSIVTAMRKATGQHFMFDWNANAGKIQGTGGGTIAQWYPGDSYVDIVSGDHYDTALNGNPATQQTAQTAWNNSFNEAAGLGTLVSFATVHNKYMAIPEWGVSGWDDPWYIDLNATFDKNPANHVYYTSYFNSSTHLLSNAPKSTTAFQSDFAGI